MVDFSDTPLDEISLPVTAEDLVSGSITIGALIASDLASRLKINNEIRTCAVLRSLVFLCRTTIERVREHFGQVTINSAFRCPELNRALDSPEKSQHVLGQAADLEVEGVGNLALARWIATNLVFDQLILEEHDEEEGPTSGWVHVSIKPPREANRHECLSFVRDPSRDKFVYVKGLVASPPR